LLKWLLTAVFSRRSDAAQILQSFDAERQNLQREFLAHAKASGKPRGLTWKTCEWLSTFTLTYDQQTDMHTMFCGVNVSFEAIEGGDMEGVEAVAMVRDGSAVFHRQGNRWGSGGRVLFNVSAADAAETIASNQTLLRTSHDVEA